jgi:DnaK suppressor protein
VKRPGQPLLDQQNQSDVIDRASSEADRELELRARERQRKLISKIDAALARLDDGTYGFCEETGEPISSIATLSVEAQERHERQEKLRRADD